MPVFTGLVGVTTITSEFQGSMLDPILPGDPRWIWSWQDVEVAASIYQAGQEPNSRWDGWVW
jgi:hypothetical protein